MPANCCTSVNDPCPQGIPNAKCVVYTGDALPCLGVSTNERLDDILVKIDALLCDVPTSSMSVTADNGLNATFADDNYNIQLGGNLIQDTTLDLSGFFLTLLGVQNYETDTKVLTLGPTNALGYNEISSLFSDVFSADNGLYIDGFNTPDQVVKLGGTLIENTDIDLDIFSLGLLNVLQDESVDRVMVLDSSDNIKWKAVTPNTNFLTSALNGLHEDNTNEVKMGGPLIENTQVDWTGFDFQFGGNNNYWKYENAVGDIGQIHTNFSVDDPLAAVEATESIQNELGFSWYVNSTLNVSPFTTIQGTLDFNQTNYGVNIVNDALETFFSFVVDPTTPDGRISSSFLFSREQSIRGAQIAIIGRGFLPNSTAPITTSEIALQTSTTDVYDSYKGIRIISTHDVILENYPSSRDDGATTKALYVDGSGRILHGSVSAGSGLAAVSHLDSDGIALTGDGSGGDPLIATGIIDPDSDNILEIRANGFFVPSFTPPGGIIGGNTGAVDNAIQRANGTGGSTVQTSVVTISDLGTIALTSNDIGALGTSILSWSDLFLANGAVINFNNGDVTLTHSSNALTLAGGSLILNDLTASKFLALDASKNVVSSTYGESDIFLLNVSTQSGTNYTLALGDGVKRFLELNSASANTLTIPTNASVSFPIGTRIELAQYGTGTTTISPAVGVTVRSITGVLSLSGQYAGAELVKIGTNEWHLVGVGNNISGNVGANDNRLVRSDGTSGGTIQGSAVLLDDSGNLTPAVNDVGALGSTTLKWADLWLANGSVINWNSSDITLTHSANLLTLSGGSLTIATGALNITGLTAGKLLMTDGSKNLVSSTYTEADVFDLTYNTRVASYTLVLTDQRRTMVEMNVAAANNLTVPLNSSVAFPIGTQILISQYGAGQTTVVGALGVTIRSSDGLKLRAQYSGATLVKRGTNEWELFGDTTP